MDDEMLVKFLLDEVTEDERRRVNRWIDESAANRKYFGDFENIWKQSRLLLQTSEVDEDAAWLRFRSRIDNATGTNPLNKRAIVVPFKKKFEWLKAAAAVLFIAGLASLFYLVNSRPSAPLQFASSDTSVADTLPDKSIVTLNKHSQLTYQEKSGNGSYRKAILKGEGFFKITPNKSKPFYVEVDGIEVKVVGTSFNIKSLPDATEIIVESGIVNVNKGNEVVTLVKGEKLLVPRAGELPQKQKNVDKLYNYYSSREFVCDGTPLWRLIEVLNEAYDTKIVLENKEAGNLELTTTFNDEPIDKVVGVIAQTFGLSVTKKGNEIRLK
jgi:transmembrane sensor